MIDWICYAMVLLFLLKLLWNILIPLVALKRHRRWKAQGGSEPGAISLVTIVEIFLLAALVVTAYVSPLSSLHAYALHMLGFGVLAIVLSYSITALLAGFLSRR